MNDWLIFVTISQLCILLAMWTMYWMRKEHKVKKILGNKEVYGCCKLQKIMLTYSEKNEGILV